MKKRIILLGATAAALLAPPSYASAAQTDAEALASRQYLIGSWNCAHTYGTFSGTYTTTYENVLGNRWIKQVYNFPPSDTTPAMEGDWLMRYDADRQAWVRFGAMTTGQYFVIRMRDISPTTTAWKYIGVFRTVNPDTPSDATFTKVSDTEYTVDGPTYNLNGTGPTVTEHHDCKKAT
jgi:hypothetical protein